MSLFIKENPSRGSIMSLSRKELQLLNLNFFAQQRILFAQQRVFALKKKKRWKELQVTSLEQREY